MKNKINIFGIFALTGILLFAACSDLMNPPNVSTGGETGKLLVQIGDAEARTLTPPSADLGDLRYNLVIKLGSGIIYEGEIKSEGYTLEAGQDYTLDVTAFNADDELLASYSDSVQIEAGKTATKKIVLRPVANVDIPGKFSYAVTLPPVDEVPYTSATLTLTPDPNGPNSGAVTINLLDSPEAEIDLPPGRYELVINVASPRQINNQPLSIYRREVVYIYSRLTTSTVDGAYAFTAEDFEAEVRFKGNAWVINASDYTINGNYIPKEVYIQLDGAYANNPVGKATIVQNTDTGVYEWELALPSHYVVTGNLTSASFWFKAQHKDTPTKVLYTPGTPQPVSSSQGNTNISLTMMVAVPNLPAYITLENNLDVVSWGDQVTAIITPPAKTGFIASSVYVDGFQVDPDSIGISSGKIKFTITVPQSPNPSFSAQFFHLNGTASAAPNADNYIAKSVEAYELDADGNPIAIGSAAAVNANNWEINVPATYVFRGAADNNVYFKVNFGLAAAGSPIVYTYDNRTDTARWDVLSLTSSTATVTLGPVSLFELTGVSAAIADFNSIVISWDDASNWATGYNVYSSADGYTTRLNATPLPRTATSYTDTTVTITAGTSYGYCVAGIRTGVTEGQRSYTSVSQLSQPNVYTYSYTTSYGGLLDSVYVYWGSVSSAVEYYVERSTNGGSWTHLTTTTSTSTSYSDSGVELVDANYQYRVTARAVSGVSNPAADGIGTSSTVYALAASQAIYWNNSYANFIASGGRDIYRLSNSGYNNIDAYLYLYRSNTNVTFTVFNTRTKDYQRYSSANGSSFSLFNWWGGNYADLILVVEGSYGSGSYDFTIQSY